ncbi:MAG: hypothetical protein ACLGI2_08805 [Acidimicrobiia bacterium]
MSPVQAPDRPPRAVGTGPSPHPLSPLLVTAALAALIALVWVLAWTAVL